MSRSGLALLAIGALLAVLAVDQVNPTLLLQHARPALLVDIFPPTPAWGTTPNSVGQVGNGERPNEGQEINVLGGSYQFPDYVRRRQSALVSSFSPPLALAWETTPNSVGSVGSGEEPATGQDINVLGGDYVFPSYVRSSDDASVPVGIFPRRSEVRDAATRQNEILIPGTKLWGGEYSSVGKFPPGFNGQRSYGGEWNVWALPTEEQMTSTDCDEPCIDGPLASIGEQNVLDSLGNDPDSPIWNADAGDQPRGITGNCCSQSALGAEGGYEEPSHAWLSA